MIQKNALLSILSRETGTNGVLNGLVAALFSGTQPDSDSVDLAQLTEVAWPGYARVPVTWSPAGYASGRGAYVWTSEAVFRPNADPQAPVQVSAWGLILPGTGTPPSPDQLVAYGLILPSKTVARATDVLLLVVQLLLGPSGLAAQVLDG
jgi:hypothetical protein